MAKRIVKRTYGGANITIGDAFIEFISEKALEGVVPNTLENYMLSFEYFLKDTNLTRDMAIENINKDSYLSWVSKMVERDMKHTTINHYIRDVRTFIYWCANEEREYITPKFKIKQIRGDDPGLKSFKEEDIQLLLTKPRKSDTFGDWRTWAIVNWVMATGNRAATICDVQIGDIDFKRRLIRLRHTKNKEFQQVPLSTELSGVLKEYMNLWLRNASSDDQLFPNVSGDKLTTNALRLAFTDYCHKRGVNQTNIHGLRHSFADISLENGRGAFELQKMLGHKTLNMTLKYINLNNQKMEKDFDKHTPLDNLKKPTSRKRKIQRTN